LVVLEVEAAVEGVVSHVDRGRTKVSDHDLTVDLAVRSPEESVGCQDRSPDRDSRDNDVVGLGEVDQQARRELLELLHIEARQASWGLEWIRGTSSEDVDDNGGSWVDVDVLPNIHGEEGGGSIGIDVEYLETSVSVTAEHPDVVDVLLLAAGDSVGLWKSSNSSTECLEVEGGPVTSLSDTSSAGSRETSNVRDWVGDDVTVGNAKVGQGCWSSCQEGDLICRARPGGTLDTEAIDLLGRNNLITNEVVVQGNEVESGDARAKVVVVGVDAIE